MQKHPGDHLTGSNEPRSQIIPLESRLQYNGLLSGSGFVLSRLVLDFDTVSDPGWNFTDILRCSLST